MPLPWLIGAAVIAAGAAVAKSMKEDEEREERERRERRAREREIEWEAEERLEKARLEEKEREARQRREHAIDQAKAKAMVLLHEYGLELDARDLAMMKLDNQNRGRSELQSAWEKSGDVVEIREKIALQHQKIKSVKALISAME